MQRIAWGMTGAIVFLAAGMTLAPPHHHGAQATSISTFQAQKQALLTQSINQALHHTRKAYDVGGVTNWKAPSPQPIPWPTIPMALTTPMVGKDAWLAGLYPGTMDEVWVMAGASKADPSTGILNVLVINTMSPSPWTGEFLTPQATGTLSITNIQGETVTWSSTSGLSGTFNLSTHVWSIS